MSDLEVRRYLKRYESLKTVRQSRMTEWQDISRHLLPRSGRFLVSKKKDQTSDYNKILDNTGTRAAKVLASGLLAGASSPARQWFRLTTSDPALAELAPVKIWLSDVAKIMMDVFARSNTYKAMHKVYSELGVFGTGVTMVMDDFDTVIHHKPLTVGEYCLANDDKGNVCTIYREFTMTVSQLVGKFGKDGVSEQVLARWRNDDLDSDVVILHLVEPRADRDPDKPDKKNMPWKSVYIEMGHNHLLSEGGFHDFPAICPRWDLTGADVYGEGLGLEALGDVRQLSHEQMAKAKSIDMMINPPMRAPTSLSGKMNIFPGGVTYFNEVAGTSSISPIYESRLDLQHLLLDIGDVRGRINSTFHEDLFLMLATDTRSGITATEVAERHEEKLLMLGPVLENIHGEMLGPLVDITFNRLLRAGALPQPPDELSGANLKTEFVSVLAQAQRMVATNGIQQLIGVVGQVGAFAPQVVDKIDADQIVDLYADALGVDPRLIVSDDNVAAIRKQRAEQQAQQEQMAQAQAAVQGAQALGNTPTGEPNALTDMMQGLQGY